MSSPSFPKSSVPDCGLAIFDNFQVFVDLCGKIFEFLVADTGPDRINTQFPGNVVEPYLHLLIAATQEFFARHRHSSLGHDDRYGAGASA